MICNWIFLLLFANFAQSLNITLGDGSNYVGDTNDFDLPNGNGKLIKENGDVYE